MEPLPQRRAIDPFKVLVFFLVVILIIGILLLVSRKSPMTKISPATIKQIIVTETPMITTKEGGSIYLKTDNTDNVGIMGQDMEVEVVANSDGKNIVGFDVVLIYDPLAVDIVSVQNEVSDYQIFSQKKYGAYTVSGIPVTQESPLNTFTDTPILTFTIRPMRKGESDLSLMIIEGSRADSNLINNSSSDILTRTGGVTVTFGDEFKLIQGVTQRIEGTDITVTLKKVILPDDSCRDCKSQADISFAKGEKSKNVSFQSGGFAGKTKDRDQVFGYSFSLVDMQVGEVTLVAIPQ